MVAPFIVIVDILRVGQKQSDQAEKRNCDHFLIDIVVVRVELNVNHHQGKIVFFYLKN